MKKIIALLILGCICICSCGCNGKSTAYVTLKKGTLSALKDSFVLPVTKSSEGAPVLGQITPKAKGDDSIFIAGSGFSCDGLKVFIYSSEDKKKCEANFTVIDDSLISVTIDASLENGIYAVYAKNSYGESNIRFVNAPKVWSVNFTLVTSGEEVCIYGENLSIDKNKTKVYLVSKDNYCEPEIVYADPYKITVKTPSVLKDGESYELYVYNGFGGEKGLAKAEDKIKYTSEAPFAFNGKTIDVTDYGADARSIKNDDTKAIEKAISAAKNGDTIYFPKGYYLINKDLKINVSVKIVGDGGEKSIILAGNGLEKAAFCVLVTPFEMTEIGFEQKRTTGKIKINFVAVKGDSFKTGTKSVHIYECRFIQKVSKKYLSRIYPIDIVGCNGVVVEDNYLDTCGFITCTGVKNTLIQNNTFFAGMLAGYYYGQDSLFFNGVETLDISGNSIQGKGAKKGGENILAYDDETAGRAIVIQGGSTNVYVGNNTIRKAGIPHCNAGEMFLLENLDVKYDGKIASADTESVTMLGSSGVQISKGDVFSVVMGKGKYQYRTVVSTKGKKVFFDSPFDVLPDENSKIIISHCFINTALYNNTFDGFTNWQQYPGGSTTSLQAYGSTHNLFMEKNKLINMPVAICLTPYYFNPLANNGKAVVSWCVFDNNYFENNGVGLRYDFGVNPGEGEIPACVSFGISVRRNSFNKTLDYKQKGWVGMGGDAIRIGPAPKGSPSANNSIWQGQWINGIMIENNTFKENFLADLTLSVHQDNVLLRKNSKDMNIVYYKGGCKAVTLDY